MDVLLSIQITANILSQISDLSFRRHILVQVLIVLDFLLSLSIQAKERLAKAPLPTNPNKSVMYADQVLGEDDVSFVLGIITSATFCA